MNKPRFLFAALILLTAIGCERKDPKKDPPSPQVSETRFAPSP